MLSVCIQIFSLNSINGSSSALPEYALGVLAYAARHGYHGIASTAAPLLLQKSLASTIMDLPGNFVPPWVSSQTLLLGHNLNRVFLFN
jgi:hypothetical protein